MDFIAEAERQKHPGQRDANPAQGDESAGDRASTPAGLARQLSDFRKCITPVIESWSDDEAADLLGIGVRQLRRRAQRGTLSYFRVHGKRRYPWGQFKTQVP